MDTAANSEANKRLKDINAPSKYQKLHILLLAQPTKQQLFSILL